MKDFYYTVKALFLIIVTILMIMLYNDYHELMEMKEEIYSPILQKVIDELERLT